MLIKILIGVAAVALLFVVVVAMRPAETIMRGELRDQSELHGVLDQIQLLGLELVEVRQIDQDNQS